MAQKQAKVIAVTTRQRHPDFPGIPTMAESGFPDFEDCRAGRFHRTGQHPSATLANTAIQQKLRGLGAVVVASTPTD